MYRPAYTNEERTREYMNVAMHSAVGVERNLEIPLAFSFIFVGLSKGSSPNGLHVLNKIYLHGRNSQMEIGANQALASENIQARFLESSYNAPRNSNVRFCKMIIRPPEN